MRRSGDQKTVFTAEAPRRGESRGSVDREIARDRVIAQTANIGGPEPAGAATVSRRIPATPKDGNAGSGSFHDTSKDLRRHLQNAWNTIRATLREIFDESAYDRFLLRTNAPRTTASYRDFTSERDAAMIKKPRCC